MLRSPIAEVATKIEQTRQRATATAMIFFGSSFDKARIDEKGFCSDMALASPPDIDIHNKIVDKRGKNVAK